MPNLSVGPQCGTCFTYLFLHLQFLGDLQIIGKFVHSCETASGPVPFMLWLL